MCLEAVHLNRQLVLKAPIFKVVKLPAGAIARIIKHRSRCDEDISTLDYDHPIELMCLMQELKEQYQMSLSSILMTWH